MGVYSSLIYLVTTCEAAKEVWDTLKAQYERKTLANKLFLRRQFFTTKVTEGQSVQAHLKAMKEIIDKFGAVGAAVTDEEKVVALFISLPPSYETLVTALEAQGDNLTLVFVEQAIINEDQKRKVAHKERTAHGRVSTLHIDKGQTQFKGKCYNCELFGHRAIECERYSNERKKYSKPFKQNRTISKCK